MSKIELVPGNSYSVEEFSSTLRKTKRGKDKFLKDNKDGYYSFSAETRVSAEEVEKLLEIVGDHQSIYHHFNTWYSPYSIKIEELEKRQEKVESNNIYSLMAARSETDFRGSFKVVVKYGQEPITVFREYTKDTTLNMRDIVSFM